MKQVIERGFLTTFFAVGFSLLLIVSGAVLYWLYDQYAAKEKIEADLPTPTATLFPTPIVVLPTPTPNRDQILADVRQSLINLHESVTPEPEIFVNRTSGPYASGSYQTTEPLASGWWLAAEIDGRWDIIAAGQGNILCQDLEGYDVPISLIPECYDATTGSVIDRASEITVITTSPEASSAPN